MPLLPLIHAYKLELLRAYQWQAEPPFISLLPSISMVFDFGSGLKDVFRRLAGMAVVDKEAVDAIMRELQRTLLQADVDVLLVAELTSRVKKRVLAEQLPGMTLKETFIRVLYEEIVAFLGAEKGELQLKNQKILLIGLFGSGKTTTSGKIARWFKSRGLRPALVACDTHRAAAQEQLRQLGKMLDVPVYDDGKKPQDIAKNALKKAKEDVIIFDSAGRDALDNELAKELKELRDIIQPDEVLLVIPADIGQAARRQAEEFRRLAGITGMIITKLDGTAKGGGALSAAAASGAAVKFIGVGEKAGDFESYDPKRFVGRLIGYGDLEGLIQKAKEAGVAVSEDEAEKLLSGKFTLQDFYEQIEQMQKMGSLSSVMNMIPGLSGARLPAGFADVQESKMKKWKFSIQSMTPWEKENPDEIKAGRISRIAKGAGVNESVVRELLSHYKQSKKVMKMARGGRGLKRGPLAQFARQLGIG